VGFNPDMAYRLLLASYYNVPRLAAVETTDAWWRGKPSLTQGKTYGAVYPDTTGANDGTDLSTAYTEQGGVRIYTPVSIRHEGNDAMVTETASHMVVAFRSTYGEFYQGKDAALMPTPLGGRHQGYYQALTDHDDRPSLLQKLTAQLDQSSKPILFTGVSRGGVLAHMAAVDYAAHAQARGVPDRIEALYTFGQPMAGDETFAASTNALLGNRYFRVAGDDPVTHMPPLPGYVHAVNPLRLATRIDMVEGALKPEFSSSVCISQRLDDAPSIAAEAVKLWENADEVKDKIYGRRGITEQVRALLVEYPRVANHFLYLPPIYALKDTRPGGLSCDDGAAIAEPNIGGRKANGTAR